MANRCDLCGKGRMVGRSSRHKRGVAGGQWKKRAPKTRKIFLPNLHPFRGELEGKTGRWKLCTKCLRKVKKELAEKQKKLAEKKPARKQLVKKSAPAG